MDTNPTDQPPESQAENQHQTSPKSMRDIIIFGVLIVIGIGVAAMLFTQS